MIPAQPTGSDLCQHCGQAIRLVNRQLGPTWVHRRGDYTHCLLTIAEPVREAS